MTSFSHSLSLSLSPGFSKSLARERSWSVVFRHGIAMTPRGNRLKGSTSGRTCHRRGCCLFSPRSRAKTAATFTPSPFIQCLCARGTFGAGTRSQRKLTLENGPRRTILPAEVSAPLSDSSPSCLLSWPISCEQKEKWKIESTSSRTIETYDHRSRTGYYGY